MHPGALWKQKGLCGVTSGGTRTLKRYQNRCDVLEGVAYPFYCLEGSNNTHIRQMSILCDGPAFFGIYIRRGDVAASIVFQGLAKFNGKPV